VLHPDRRPAYPRAALLVIALFSAVLLGGVQDMACESHGLGTMSSRTADAGVDANAAAGRTGEAMPGMSHATGDQSSDDGESECRCTCLGDCTLAAPLAVSPAASTLRVAVADAQPRHPVDTAPAYTPSREPDRLLPFGNGPPARSSALS
jgi:hypothetical protein